MTITIVAANGEQVTASAERWLCGLIALVAPAHREHLLSLVGSRLELDARPQGHVIGVPGIVSVESVNGR